MKKEIYSAISKFYPFKSLDSFALTYHSINDFNHDFTPKLYQLQLDSFFEQIRFLEHKNIESPDHVEDLFNPNRKCILTFDDGFSELFEICLKQLEHYNFHSHIFVCPKFIKSNKKEYLSNSQITEMIKSKKITFGSHSFSHLNLRKLNIKDLEYEIEYSKKWLEDKFSIPINNFCYPFGQYNQKVVDVVKSKKYNHAFTTQFGTISKNTDPYQIPRIDIWNKDSIGDFNLKIEGKYNWHNNIHFLKKLIK